MDQEVAPEPALSMQSPGFASVARRIKCSDALSCFAIKRPLHLADRARVRGSSACFCYDQPCPEVSVHMLPV